MSPSSRGLGHRVLIPATWVRIPLEMPFFCLFFQESLRNPRKKQATAWQINLPVVAFSFCRYFFAMQKKWDYSLSCGLPILQKISLRRRESRLAARALPSAVKSIFRRPRSAAFRRHPPYSCLEYGSVDYIIFWLHPPDLYQIRSSRDIGAARHFGAARLPPKKSPCGGVRTASPLGLCPRR